MSTITSRYIVEKAIAQDGYFEGDPRIHMIVEYTNAWNEVCWGVTWVNETPQRRTRYLDETEFVRNPKVIWRAE